MEVEHEVGEGALEAGTLAEVDDEAGAGDLGGAVEVEDAEGLAELPVGLGGEVEGGDFAPGFFEAVAVLVLADRDVVLGEVGQGLEDGAEAVVGLGGGGLEGVDLGLELAGLLGLGGGVGAGAAELGDLLGELVALGLEGLELGDGVATGAVDGGEVAEGDGGVGATGTQFLFNQGQIGPHER